jgi:hypothetical protein
MKKTKCSMMQTLLILVVAVVACNAILSVRLTKRVFIGRHFSVAMVSGNSDAPLDSLSGGGSAVFTLARQNDLTRGNVDALLDAIDVTAGSYRTLRDQEALLTEYKSLLSSAAVVSLDPLMMATFDVLSGSIMDTLVKMESGAAITDLVDKVTDVHLDYIEEFCTKIDDGGSEGYSQSSNQEFLAYQFAGLVFRTYSKISRGLGSDYDVTATAVDMRTDSWVSTVYARLQRRFVRFLAANVEETVQDQNAISFERFFERIKIEIDPRYCSLTERHIPQDGSAGAAAGGGGSGEDYPAWKLTAFLMKVIRNIITEDDKERLEPSLSRQFQNKISAKMRRISRPLATIAADEDKYAGISLVRGTDNKQVQQLEDFLQSGHESVAAVLSLWHVRHNIVGVADSEGKVVKDYLRGVSFTATDQALQAIPQKVQREGLVDVVDELVSDLPEGVHISDALRSAAILAHAVRATASEEFRALITYNADSSDIPASRDSLYGLLLRSVLESALDPTSASSCENNGAQWLYENLVAVAALEETAGVREPRAACVSAYQAALHSVAADVLRLADGEEGRGADSAWLSALSARIEEVEVAMVLMNRLPADILPACRASAFRCAVNGLMSAGGNGGSAEKGKDDFASGRKRVEEGYPVVASLLRVPLEKAKGFVLPMGQTKFDQSVGRILMSADLVLGQESEGVRYKEQLMRLAEDVMIPNDVAQQRVLLLGGAAFESMVEAALEEYRRMNEDLADAALKKASALRLHPLWAALGKEGEVMKIASKMVVSRLGISLVSEILRMVESLRKRQEGGKSSSIEGGWGSADTSSDPRYIAFLEEFQKVLLADYSDASMN